MFLALRPDEPAYGIVEDLARSLPGAAKVYPLEPLDLNDTAARSGLLSFLNWRVPATRGVPEAQILASIDGYPGVIYQWTSDYQRETMRSVEDLERVAGGCTQVLVPGAGHAATGAARRRAAPRGTLGAATHRGRPRSLD